MSNTKAKSIFLFAIENHSPDQWEGYVQRACVGDPWLRAQVDKLLKGYRKLGTFHEDADRGTMATGGSIGCEGIGATIGPYKLREQIGEGGMGVVYVAEQSEPVTRKVALKVIKPGMDTRQVIARFEAERQALAMMDHPNIAKVHDGGATDAGRPYFVMELVQGPSITDYCDQQRLSTRQRLKVFVKVCNAVQHAHQKGIIHRDLKPSNILVPEIDGTAVPKVIDFGVAKAVDRKLAEQTVYTQFAQLVGTPLYMSPEQAGLGVIDVDTRSDVYSLGVLLYELLTGSTPFDSDTLKQVGFDEMRRIIREEPPRRPSATIGTLQAQTLSTVSERRRADPRQLGESLRSEIDWLVMKALDKDRDRRYESASALAGDVERYLNSEPVEACPPSPSYRFRKFAARNKAAVTTAALVLSTLLCGVLGTSWQAVRATRESDEKRAALATASDNLMQANQQRDRAEANLQLAMRAVEEAYLEVIGEDRLLRLTAETIQWDWGDQNRHGVMGPKDLLVGDSAKEQVLTDQEKKLIVHGLSFYQQIAQENPTSPRAMFESARALSRIGLLRAGLNENSAAQTAYQEAISGLRKLTELDPTRTEYFVELARSCFQQGRLSRWWPSVSETFVQSVQAADRAIALTPDCLEAFRIRGMAHYQLQQFDQAAADFVRVLELDPSAAPAHHHLSRAYNKAQAVDLAIAASERSLELDPENMDYRDHLVSVLRWGKKDQDAAAAALGQGLTFVSDPLVEYDIRSRAAEILENHKETIRFTDQMLVLGGTSPSIHLRRARAWRGMQEFERAQAELGKAHEATETGGQFARLAAEYINHGQHHAALAAFEQAEELTPNEHLCYEWRGSYLASEGQHREALADFDKVLRLASHRTHIYKRRAAAHFHVGDFDEALADFSRAFEHDPDDHNILAQISRADVTDCPDESFRFGFRQLLDKVIDHYSREIAADALGVQNWHKRGYVQLQLGDLKRAIEDYSEAIRLQPREVKYWNNRGIGHLDIGQYQEAVEDCSQAIRLDPKREWHWNNRGYAYEQLGHLEKALKDYDEAVRIAPGRALHRFNRATAYKKLGEAEMAIVDYSCAIQLEPMEARYWSARGILYAELDQLEKAVEDLSQAIKLEPKKTEHWSNRALAFSMLRRWDKASRDRRKAVSVDGNDPMSQNALAWFLVTCPSREHRNPSQAVDHARRAVSLASDVPACWSTLGAALYRNGEFEEAARALERSMQLDNGGDCFELFVAAMVNWQLSNKEQARALYESGLSRMAEKHGDAVRKELQMIREEAEQLLGVGDTENDDRRARH